ncbi:MAG: oxygen-independent coproporphyrinogen III oxidase [Bdellovibrionales bacterium]
MKIRRDLIEKYDVPVPRYTSYPTVPYWSESPTTEQWIDSLQRAFAASQATWSLYVHVPFCETLCTFCGCNTVIGKNHDREKSYVDLVLAEFQSYLNRVPSFKHRPLKQLHLGGGTPTFLNEENLRILVTGLLAQVKRVEGEFDGSLEVDPRRTRPQQLKILRELGFERVSMGVQDFDAEVQRLVNRVQPFEMTRDLTASARAMGYKSVNYDLIYGLPKQQLASFARSIDMTIDLRPDRIALYSFALVPWIKPQQRLFKDSDLPAGAEKRELYEMAYEKLTEAGYLEIGMDHFALPDDALAKAQRVGELHRNFMGYTEWRTDVMLGLGVSSISEAPDCFHQNEKVLPVYERRVKAGEIPTLRGHRLSEQDRQHRRQILDFMTTGRVQLRSPGQVEDIRSFLAGMLSDGLVKLNGTELSVTEEGRPFIRNACVALDQRLRDKQPSTRIFSQAL